MELDELTQVVSVCLDCIEELKSENAVLKKTIENVAAKCELLEKEQHHYLRGEYEPYIFRAFAKLAYYRNREKLLRSGVIRYDERRSAERFNGKGVVYSVITGGYDHVREIEVKNPDLDYIMFTDNPDLRSETWEIRLLDNSENLDPIRLSRKPKILPHLFLQDYDYSVYVDGKLAVIGDPIRNYIELYRDRCTMLCCGHFLRDCIYEEGAACINGQKDDPQVITGQMKKYFSEGYPIKNGLNENALIIREHHDPKLIAVMETWWDQVLKHSYRDQLSLMYACWVHEYCFDLSDVYIYDNDFVKMKGKEHNC